MEERKFNVTCVRNYYGFPQAFRVYEIEGSCGTFKLSYYGNQGFGLLENKNLIHNGDFWDLRVLRQAIVDDSIRIIFELKEGESKAYSF